MDIFPVDAVADQVKTDLLSRLYGCVYLLQSLGGAPARVPLFLTPLRKRPGESPEEFAHRAVGQIKRGLARQLGIVRPHPNRAAGGRIAARIDAANANHHLWDNHGTWWIHYTIHKPDHTAVRIRRSLRTSDVEEARALRDAILDQEEKGGTAS